MRGQHPGFFRKDRLDLTLDAGKIFALVRQTFGHHQHAQTAAAILVRHLVIATVPLRLEAKEQFVRERGRRRFQNFVRLGDIIRIWIAPRKCRPGLAIVDFRPHGSGLFRQQRGHFANAFRRKRDLRQRQFAGQISRADFLRQRAVL